jgi:hypothetical protein
MKEEEEGEVEEEDEEEEEEEDEEDEEEQEKGTGDQVAPSLLCWRAWCRCRCWWCCSPLTRSV